MRSTSTPMRAALAATLAALAGCGETTAPRRAAPPPASAAELVSALADAYRTRDADRFAALLSDAPGAEYRSLLAEPVDGTWMWDVATERLLHRRMFRPGAVPAGEIPVPSELALQSVSITLTPQTAFAERADLYASPANPGGLDPERWRATQAMYGTDVFWEMAGGTDYMVAGRAVFIVIEDLGRAAGEAGKFLLYAWEDLGNRALVGQARAAVEERAWSAVKLLYARASAIRSEADLVTALADAYRGRDPSAYAAVLCAGAGAEFRFVVEGAPEGPVDWGLAEETRIHRRMFAPQDIPPGEPPLDPEHWLVHVALVLAPHEAWAERPQYYRSAANAGGLDAGRWRAQGAVYGHDVFFEVQGDTDYLVDGRSDFVVAVDTWKPVGVPGRFLLYRWIDFDSGGALAATQAIGWWAFKKLYR